MYIMGLRIGEARNVNPDWIDASRQFSRVIGKGDKERIVTLPTPFIEYLRSIWILHRNPDCLFATRSDRPLSRKVLYTAFRRARESIGLPDTVTSHVLRHSYATRMLERKLPTPVLQILMGHASAKTTQQYLHLTEPTREAVRSLADGLVSDLIAPER
jgi:site-specific recombinase XerD